MRRAGWLPRALLLVAIAAGVVWAVAFVRLVPLFPFTLTSFAPGVSRIERLPYVAATLTCMLPGAVAYTWLGHGGRGALAGDVAAIRFAPRRSGRWPSSSSRPGFSHATAGSR